MNGSTSSLPATVPPSIAKALRHLLKPFVRLLLNFGIGYPMLLDLLKSAYVEVAERDFRIDGKPQTISRISLLTGVHRKDVKRLLELAAAEEGPSRQMMLAARLVATWTGAPEYLDAEGRPLPLARTAKQADEKSFEALVESISKDIRPRAVLDEWLRLGVAHLDAQDRVCLDTDAFVPQQGFDEKAFYFGQNIHDHLAAICHNLSGDAGRKPMLERCVFYTGLTPYSVTELARYAESAGMRAIQAVNRRALELEKRDFGAAAATERMNFGVYFFRDQESLNARERP